MKLVYSNRLEALLEGLGEAIREERGEGGNWRRSRIIVPNRQVARVVREHLASTQGIAANLEFGFLDGLIREFLPDGARLLDRPAIEGALLRRFQTGEGLEAEALGPVRRYLEGASPERRVAQLAFKLGGLFEEYLLSRPDWFPAWETGKAALDGDDLDRCEGALWRMVRQDLGRPGRIWLTPAQAVGAFRRDLPKSEGGIHFFAMTHLAPVFQHALDALGRLLPGLRVYALNPCREFWDDLKDERSARRAARRLEALRGTGGTDPEDPYLLLQAEEAEQPLLRRWGRPGREKIHLLNELADWDFEDAFEDPGRGSLLHALQQDVLNRAAPDPACAPGEDGSVRIHVCPAARREAETIAEQIWALLRENPGDLRFSDIAVMVPPAALPATTLHLASAFGGEPRIPFTQLHRSARATAELAEAFASLLDLATSPLSRAGILAFVRLPAVRRRFENLDPESWARWCQDTGIVRGADRADLEPVYFTEDALSWDQGLRRLALGAFMSAEGGAFASHGQDYLPREIGAGDWEEAGQFLLGTRALLTELRSVASESHGLEAWSRRLGGLMETWAGGPDPQDRAALSKLRIAIDRLGDLEPEGLDGPSYPFATAAELARQELERAVAQASGSRIEGVAVGDPESLRGLPFRVIFLAALDEGAFPARDPADDLDLRSRKRLPGDVRAHERDRYLALEALLSARDHLILSYTARDPVTAEAIQPSPVLQELLRTLGETLGHEPQRSLWTHPLLRWDARRFLEHPNLLPAEPSVYLEARAEARYRHPWNRDSLPAPDPGLEPLAETPGPSFAAARIRLSLSQLRAFLESPLQGSAKAALGLEDEGEDAAQMEEEASDTPPNLRVPLLKSAFQRWRTEGRDPLEAYAELRRELERQGKAPLGGLAGPEREADSRVLEAWSDQVPARIQVRFARLGPAFEARAGDPGETLDPLVLELARAADAPLQIELRGALEPQADLGGGPGSLLLLRGQPGSRRPPLARHLIRAWLSQLVQAAVTDRAQGPQTHPPHQAYLVSGEAGPARTLELPVLAPGEAEARLTALVEDLLQGRHPHLLPLEAVVEEERIGSGEELAAWIEEAVENPEYARLSDLFGPVPHPLSYPAADTEALQRRRRLLRPVLASLGVEE
jgi:exodeoxyribonuclease V gamma subunit